MAMDERKLRHDYLNSVQILKSVVRLAAKGKLVPGSPDTQAIIEEAEAALAFLDKLEPAQLKKEG